MYPLNQQLLNNIEIEKYRKVLNHLVLVEESATPRNIGQTRRNIQGRDGIKLSDGKTNIVNSSLLHI
jgi:hypothetical protein